MADPWSVVSQAPASKDPWAVVEESPQSSSPRKTARHGLNGPDAIEKAEFAKHMGQAPDSTFGEQFMGAVTSAIPSAAAGAYSLATTNPVTTVKAIARGVADLPGDLVTDIKQGKFGKLTAQALLLALPGIGNERAAEWAEAANAAASRAAKKITASGVPEAVGGAIGESLTPDVVKRIRARLNPKEPAVEGFKPSPSTARKMRYGGPTEEEYSAPASGKTPAVRPSQRLSAPKEEATQAPVKFTPSKDVARNIKYGGPTEEGYSAPATGKVPAVRPSQRIPAPAKEAAPKPQAPARFTPSKSTARNMRYGGPTEADYSAPSARVGGRGRAAAAPVQDTASTAQAGEPSPKGKLEAPAVKTETPAAKTESPAAGANSQTAKNARTIARKLKAAGMTPSQLESLGPDEIAEYAKQIGLSPGNARALRQQALFEFRKL